MIKHVISVSGGKDSQAVVLIALARVPIDSLIFIFCDTGNEHDLVYQHLDYLENRLGIVIVRLKANFDDRIAAKRLFIARDRRIKRVYETVPVFEKDGKTKVLKRDGFNNIVTRKVYKDGLLIDEPVQKTKKIGGGRLVRWSNKAKQRVLKHLIPTGIPYLDLCMWKGRFPSRKAQFCTQELKTAIAVEFQIDLVDAGYSVISWQGIRRDESESRKDAKLYERIGRRMWVFRPIIHSTAQQVVDFSLSKDTRLCALYSMGMGRVGCMPCINAGKEELRQIALRCNDHVVRISEWELIVALCSKRGLATFFAAPGLENYMAAKRDVFEVIKWAKTTRGGRQMDLLGDLDSPTSCSSSYGLCDQPSAVVV
ncbi:MAG TPA: phosphoadenosine phosphosulfate reductase family protein [Methyloradius sp.]